MPFVTEEASPDSSAHRSNGPTRWRKRATHLIKVLIGVAIVAYLASIHDAAEIGRALAAANVLDIALACFFGGISLYSYALMYAAAVRPLGMPLTAAAIMRIQLQIRFYALFMPGAANMLVKWYKLARPGKQPAQALILMGFTRILLTISMLCLALVGIAADSLFPWSALRIYLLATLLLALTALFALTSTKIGDGLQSLLNRKSALLGNESIFERKVEKAVQLSTAFGTLTNAQILSLLTLALVGSVFQSLQMLSLAQAVGVPLSFVTILWLRGVSQVVAMIPISIAGLGVREASMVAILVGYGISESEAISFSLLIFIVVILGKGIVGGVLEGWEQLHGASAKS